MSAPGFIMHNVVSLCFAEIGGYNVHIQGRRKVCLQLHMECLVMSMGMSDTLVPISTEGECQSGCADCWNGCLV